jgi:tRNA(Ile)-lysidine synthase TilS/MesJ
MICSHLTIIRGSNPLNLSGMTEIGLVNGIIVWRPLLSHTKDEIYKFAHKSVDSKWLMNILYSSNNVD